MGSKQFFSKPNIKCLFSAIVNIDLVLPRQTALEYWRYICLYFSQFLTTGRKDFTTVTTAPDVSINRSGVSIFAELYRPLGWLRTLVWLSLEINKSPIFIVLLYFAILLFFVEVLLLPSCSLVELELLNSIRISFLAIR